MALGSSSDAGSRAIWSPTLFLVAGVLLAGHAAVWAVRLVTDLRPPTGALAASGHLVALGALVALYPVLADRTPSLARAAAVMAAVPAAGWFVIAAEQVGEIAGLLSPGVTALHPAFYVAVAGATVVAYGLFTVASRRAGVDSWSLTLLLLAPATLLLAGFAAQAITQAAALSGVVTGTGLALSMLAVGVRLRTTVATDRSTPADGVAAG